MTILAFIFWVVIALFASGIVTHRKDTQPKNKVHFYVARDKSGALWLYFNKPFRYNGGFFGGVIKVPLTLHRINRLGLNKVDCANIKWEDEPVEVFINVGD